MMFMPFLLKKNKAIATGYALVSYGYIRLVQWLEKDEGRREGEKSWVLVSYTLICLHCMFSYVSIGRFLYSPNLRKPQQLGGGLESWRGFYQSIRPTQMGLSLNIGESSTISSSFFTFIELRFFYTVSHFNMSTVNTKKLLFFFIFPFDLCFFVLLSDMSSMAFIEPLPVIDFVAQILGKDVLSKPLSDADRVKV